VGFLIVRVEEWRREVKTPDIGEALHDFVRWNIPEQMLKPECEEYLG
jgi:hypothetical protein